MKRLNLIKARKNMTQYEVAKNIGITQKYLSKLELGLRNPSTRVLVQITNFYQRTADELFPDIFLPSNTSIRSINENQKVG